MEKIRTDNNPQESGIALVTTLVITIVIMMLIGGLTYLSFRSISAVTINRQFSTVYEAANGGVEFTTGIIIDYSKDPNNPPSQIGQFSPDEATFRNIVYCEDMTSTARLEMKSADGKFLITTEVRCLGFQRLPGEGGALRFPPPPAKGGLKTKATMNVFYSIVAIAREAGNTQNIARTEAVYRLLQ